ncbi:MAG: HEAT repeat domain-containing protein [Phycisphaerae bacterium]|nr:HEAT repeat domain-containing protein [Phycisphaerae bacterium]
MKRLVILHILWISLSACFLAGCGGRRDIAADFQDEDPKTRIAAIRGAGREKLESAVPYLVDRLTDSEAEVRMFAIIALQEITGLAHGYRHYDPATLRQEAVERWRKWLSGSRDQSLKTQPAGERKTG